MQSDRKFQFIGLALQFVAIAVAAAAVYVADTLPDRVGVSRAQAASPVVATRTPLVAVNRLNEAWSADESAAGTRSDAAH